MASFNPNLNNLKLKPLYQWRLSLLLPGACLIMLAISYLIYNNFTVERTNVWQEQVKVETGLKEQLAFKYRLIKSIPLYQQKMQELTQLESVVNQQFPSSDDLPNLLIQINQLAEDNNIAVNSLIPNTAGGSEVNLPGLAPNAALPAGQVDPKAANSPLTGAGAKENSGKIWSKGFTLTATANYIDFTRFIYALAGLPRVLKIDNLSINRIDDSKVSVSLNITIYYSN